MTARRYGALIGESLKLLAVEPLHPLARTLSVATSEIHLFHIRHVRPPGTDKRIRSPRHVLAYRFDDTRLEVAQFLHDAMDIPSRLR